MNFYENATLTIDGEPYGFADVNVEPEPAYGCDLSALLRPADVTVECTVPMRSLDDFASLFRQEPPGASAETLVRRVRYGGRKGRRALQRLFAHALPIEYASPVGARFRGRAVVLDEGEIRVRLHGPVLQSGGEP